MLHLAPQTRVAGGGEAERNEFPWAALILIQVGSDQAVCGGTLVSDRWHVPRSLARAHCATTGTWSLRHIAWRIGTLAPLKLGWVSRNSIRYTFYSARQCTVSRVSHICNVLDIFFGCLTYHWAYQIVCSKCKKHRKYPNVGVSDCAVQCACAIKYLL